MGEELFMLIQTIISDVYKNGIKPVTVQTGIMENETEVSLDQQMTVTPTLPKKYSEGVNVHVEGTLNGQYVEGDLKLTYSLKAGDKVKIIKEDGVSKYYLAGELEP